MTKSRELKSLLERRAKSDVLKKRDPIRYGFKHKQKMSRELKSLTDTRAKTDIIQKRDPKLFGFKFNKSSNKSSAVKKRIPIEFRSTLPTRKKAQSTLRKISYSDDSYKRLKLERNKLRRMYDSFYRATGIQSMKAMKLIKKSSNETNKAKKSNSNKMKSKKEKIEKLKSEINKFKKLIELHGKFDTNVSNILRHSKPAELLQSTRTALLNLPSLPPIPQLPFTDQELKKKELMKILSRLKKVDRNNKKNPKPKLYQSNNSDKFLNSLLNTKPNNNSDKFLNSLLNTKPNKNFVNQNKIISNLENKIRREVNKHYPVDTSNSPPKLPPLRSTVVLKKRPNGLMEFVV